MSQLTGYSLSEERALKPVQIGPNMDIFKRFYSTDKKTSVPLEWYGFDMGNNHKSEVSILCVSKPVKYMDETPSTVLFKTYTYEIRIVPSKEFFAAMQRNYGYSAELQLYRKTKLGNKKVAYFEYIGEHPYIQYTFEEDFSTPLPTWIIRFSFSTDRSVNFKGDFSLRLQIFGKQDHDVYRRLFSKFSSGFAVVSKPSVVLKRQRKNEDGKTEMDLSDWRDYLPEKDEIHSTKPKQTNAGNKQAPKPVKKKPFKVENKTAIPITKPFSPTNPKNGTKQQTETKIDTSEDAMLSDAALTTSTVKSKSPPRSKKRKRGQKPLSIMENESAATDSPQDRDFEMIQRYCEELDKQNKRQKLQSPPTELLTPPVDQMLPSLRKDSSLGHLPTPFDENRADTLQLLQSPSLPPTWRQTSPMVSSQFHPSNALLAADHFIFEEEEDGTPVTYRGVSQRMHQGSG